MRTLIFSFTFWTAFSISLFAHAAAQYTPITGFPGLNGNNLTTEDYVKALYMLSITVAGTLAVVKIIFSGVKYMLSDVVTTKGDAVKDIRGALLGILIVMGAYLILYTINPNLTKLSIFGNAPSLTALSAGNSAASPTTPRTEADQCPAGQVFVKTTQYPDGTCEDSQSTALGGENYASSTGEGNYVCSSYGPNYHYDAGTNSCIQDTPINKPPASIIQQRQDEAGGDTSYFIVLMREWCQTAYPDTTSDYDATNQSCVQPGTQ